MDAYLDPNTLTALEAGFTEGLIFIAKRRNGHLLKN